MQRCYNLNMERYVCIHGHFYQPPRENPWLEAIQLQDSACPYHDWNELVTAQCYAPNSFARILDGEGRIISIVNNYSRISFNVGPTLLAWMEGKSPDTYHAILDADRESQKNYSGHGSALAQAYSHMILPLANRNDKYTQLIWGVRDFEKRFKRYPEGMWLPETGVDLEVLDILAELGIKFTILAPHQASKVRPIGTRPWRDVSGARIDPTMAYEAQLPTGRKINLFFYDAPISHAVAFEDLLMSGERFATRLLDGFSETRTWPQIVNIATDGETYGHHREHGDMALAYALHYIQSNKLACLTNYGEFLEEHPPTHQVQIVESSSWSCLHGVQRWRANCGCNTGMHSGWSQGWRAPLREAVDHLRDTLIPSYEEMAGRLLKDPWAARNDYVSVILDRSEDSVKGFMARNARGDVNTSDRATILKLLELQRHAMLMFTSCGWFFDELSGIETVQILQYAGRALQLAQSLFGDSLESSFLELLERAPSNLPEYENGRRIYQRFVRPAMVDLQKVAAHYAMSSLFDVYGESAEVYCYRVHRDDYHVLQAGESSIVMGKARVTSEVTGESSVLSFGVLHFGDHNLNAGVRTFRTQATYQGMVHDMNETFTQGDLAEVLRVLDKHFDDSIYSLKSLFRDEQRQILDLILASTLAEAEATYRQLHEHHGPLLHFLTDLGAPLPKALHAATELVLNADLRRVLEQKEVDMERIEAIVEEARRWHVALDSTGIEYEVRNILEPMVTSLRTQPDDLPLLIKLETMASIVRSFSVNVNLWKVQNAYYEILKTAHPRFRRKGAEGDRRARTWLTHFTSLGESLGIRITDNAGVTDGRPGCETRQNGLPGESGSRPGSSPHPGPAGAKGRLKETAQR